MKFGKRKNVLETGIISRISVALASSLLLYHMSPDLLQGRKTRIERIDLRLGRPANERRAKGRFGGCLPYRKGRVDADDGVDDVVVVEEEENMEDECGEEEKGKEIYIFPRRVVKGCSVGQWERRKPDMERVRVDSSSDSDTLSGRLSVLSSGICSGAPQRTSGMEDRSQPPPSPREKQGDKFATREDLFAYIMSGRITDDEMSWN
ncbi:hypothetical protein CPB84DRAFT_1744324 [Gymnopilus junonius]|uniref:Uncharacterized protein n=1 Tax=Gymnopilus junonius TaxID=109634 RepID=A0A9P5NXU6_GYMJU|nr:hypothetical protein CPB84DRAFT_1744324 [Gymnopilus junonius]